jgi:uncharacterized protein Smg (DUF494 family)
MDLALDRQNIRLEDERLSILILLWKAAADENIAGLIFDGDN